MTKSTALLLAVAGLLLVLAASAAPRASAVTCNIEELKPCLSAFVDGTPVTKACCGKVDEQRPCLCGFWQNDPFIKKYRENPNIETICHGCGVPFPPC